MMQFGASENDATVGGPAVRSISAGVGGISSIFEKRSQRTLHGGGTEDPTSGKRCLRQASLGSTDTVLKANKVSRMNDCNDEFNYRGSW